MGKIYDLGIDVGSTTVKTVILDEGEFIYNKYERHFSKVRETVAEQLRAIRELYPDDKFKIAITGSAGLGIAEASGISFVQEVFSAFIAVNKKYPKADVVVELGGEDAKIIFLTGGVEQRMNGSCAGGTGAFIDQMAGLLGVTPDEMNDLALKAEKTYPIASRCGVFAKSDIQPLLNQGARKEDIAASIFQAVVDQTVSGLAQGRKIGGQVLFLGGPLTYLSALRKAFRTTLNLDEEHAILPENSSCYMAFGAALHADTLAEEMTIDEALDKIVNAKATDNIVVGKPLFASREEYNAFVERHKKSDLKYEDIRTYRGDAYLGIDAGSTTTKLVLITPDGKLLYQHYCSNKGQPLDIIASKLEEIYSLATPELNIKASAVTGYGEDLIKAGLGVDYGIVETVAHYKAAAYFCPDVDFIIDIGGQDIKAISIDENGAVKNFLMNDKCAAGTGRFLEMMARTLGLSLEEMSVKGLDWKENIVISSMCTVFAESEVVSLVAQNKDVADIIHGLNVSVASKVGALAARLGQNNPGEYMMTGGVAKNPGIVHALEEKLGAKLYICEESQLCGALGAAIFAFEKCKGE